MPTSLPVDDLAIAAVRVLCANTATREVVQRLIRLHEAEERANALMGSSSARKQQDEAQHSSGPVAVAADLAAAVGQVKDFGVDTGYAKRYSRFVISLFHKHALTEPALASHCATYAKCVRGTNNLNQQCSWLDTCMQVSA